jgi:hypothetical protein
MFTALPIPVLACGYVAGSTACAPFAALHAGLLDADCVKMPLTRSMVLKRVMHENAKVLHTSKAKRGKRLNT